MKRVGVIGCGLMGQGMIQNLLQQKYDVTIYDVNDQATIHLVEKGATRAKDVATLAKDVDVLLLSLPTPTIIQEVLLKEAYPVMKVGSFVLDMSTNDVEVTRDLAKKAQNYGITFFDCPLSGGPAGANAGKLTIMVGGEKTQFPAIFPILEAIGEQIEYIGDNGAGQIVKLCNNMLVGGIISLASEVLKTGERVGVSKEKITELMQKGSAQTRVMDVFGPSILSEDFDTVTFSLANMMKDLQLYENMTVDANMSTNISGSVKQLYQAASDEGKGAKDATAVYELVK